MKAWRRELATWARAHGVDGRSFNLWRVNVERDVLQLRAPAPKLVELVVPPSRRSLPRQPLRNKRALPQFEEAAPAGA